MGEKLPEIARDGRTTYQKIEVLLILPLDLTLFFVWWQFRHVIKAMADVVNIIKAMADVRNMLNNDGFFEDTVDTTKEGFQQHKKREYSKSVIGRGNECFLGGKWTKEKVEKASNETINKTHVEYKQLEQNQEGEKTGKVLGKYVINFHSTGISWAVKIRDAKKLWQYIENDPIIKDQMADLGYLLVCTFGKILAPVLLAAHTVNNLDLGD